MTRLTLKWLLGFALMSGSATAADAPVKTTPVEKTQKEDPAGHFIPDSPAEIRKVAEEGDANAQFSFGLMYAKGDGVPPDSAEAVKWIRRAAEQGVAQAQLLLSLMYATGNGVPKDSTEAVKWCRKAAEQGDAIAQGSLGEMYATGDGVPKDSAEALKWYRKGADQGNADVQYSLGFRYITGDGVPKDSNEGGRWYRKAAEQGNADAQFGLGVLYAEGDGVPKDNADAARWFRKAASQGHAPAQFCLGVFFFSGLGVEKSRAEAENWLSKAAGNLYVPARLWYRSAAEQGDPIAQNCLGFNYRYGWWGVSQDIDEAIGWYRKAADQGYAESQYQLGTLFRDGVGVTKNYAEAVKFFRAAAMQGDDPHHQYWLADMYLAGKGAPKNEVEALAWLNIAAASGNVVFIESRNQLEVRLGRQIALIAQQRSAEIMQQIETSRSAHNRSNVPGSSTTFPLTGDAPRSSGSGAIVSATGHILTAAHVVAGASRIKIITAKGAQIASVLRIDEANDLAVLKLTAGTYPALPVAPSRRIRLGQTVATIGFPNVEIQGFSPKVTRGEISSLNGIGDDPRAWQISVPVQPGNSGGALLDENGNVIGVVVSKLGLKAAQATGDIPQNVNYAVKSTYALALLEPYLDSSAPEPNQSAAKPRFEDMVAKAQQSVVLILVY